MENKTGRVRMTPQGVELPSVEYRGKEIRTEKNIPLKTLAPMCGVPRSTLYSWEDGTRLPRDVYQLYRAAYVLGVTIEDLVGLPRLRREQTRTTPGD